MSNFREQDIFSDFVASIDIDISLDMLEDELVLMQKDWPSIHKSNTSTIAIRIGGYQSPDFGYFGEDCPYKTFNSLRSKCVAAGQEYIMQRLNKLVSKDMYSWWCNINHVGDCNLLHHHTRTDLVGVFYIKSERNSGRLILTRNDGAQYCDMMHRQGQFFIKPTTGRLYLFPGHIWHRVEPNDSGVDRISVSFNMYTALSESLLSRLPQ